MQPPADDTVANNQATRVTAAVNRLHAGKIATMAETLQTTLAPDHPKE